MSNASHATPDSHGDAHASAEHGHLTQTTYIMIFFTLVILTVVTVLIAFKRFDNEMVNVLLALLVATVKATFVARFFMHLKFEGKLIRVIFFVPLALTVLIIAALIPDVGRGLNKVAHLPKQMEPDVSTLDTNNKPIVKMSHY